MQIRTEFVYVLMMNVLKVFWIWDFENVLTKPYNPYMHQFDFIVILAGDAVRLVWNAHNTWNK